MIRNKTCRHCDKPLERRRARYCDAGCKRQARNQRNARKREFDEQAAYVRELGEDLAKRSFDGGTPEEWIENLADYLPEPDGRTALAESGRPSGSEISTLRDMAEAFGYDEDVRTWHVTDMYSLGLMSQYDIDQAYLTGDWTPMVRKALQDMKWQLANGYEPDLREFEGI